MAGTTSDEALLARAATDAAAFGEFYERHAEAVFAYLRRRTGNSDVAADLTAEVFAAALLSSKNFKPGPLPARAWLFGIVNHKLSDSRRRERIETRARQRLGITDLALDDDELERAEWRVDATFDGSASSLVHDLPPDQRAAVLARVVDERDYADLARVMRVSEANVRQRVSRGLARLATLLQGDSR
jgi:RNA polymerase sigma-70 factor (ECF subfamily)